MAPALVLVRHGQASFGAADYDVLSETGRRQARIVGEALRGRGDPVRTVITGTMRRQRETAAACLDAMGLPARWTEDSGWDEFDHEEVLRVWEPGWANRIDPGSAPADAERLAAFDRGFFSAVARWTGGAHDADYREAWPAFLARVDRALERLSREAEGSALVFTSGGPIAAACRTHLGARNAPGVLSHAFRLANASVTTLQAGPEGLALLAFNDHAHLSGAGENLLTFR